jgi:dephospho-CoA kinase
MNKPVIAIVGLPGAGKTVSVEHTMRVTGWPKVYFGGVVMEEVQKRGLPVNEQNERSVREELRATHGMGMAATLSLPKVRSLLETSAGVFIESLYSWEEYVIMKKEFGEDFKVIAIYSSPATRIARLEKRPERTLTPQEVESRDYSQIENLHQAGPIARAEYTIVNESDMEKLYSGLDEILTNLGVKG